MSSFVFAGATRHITRLHLFSLIFLSCHLFLTHLAFHHLITHQLIIRHLIHRCRTKWINLSLGESIILSQGASIAAVDLCRRTLEVITVTRRRRIFTESSDPHSGRFPPQRSRCRGRVDSLRVSCLCVFIFIHSHLKERRERGEIRTKGHAAVRRVLCFLLFRPCPLGMDVNQSKPVRMVSDVHDDDDDDG